VAERSLELLDEPEMGRYRRFAFDEDRARFLVAHGLKRRVLEHHTGIDAREWTFVKGEHGRPEPSGESSARGLRFNISHTEGLVACVVHGMQDCGIDVEYRNRRASLEPLMRRCFTPEERQWIGTGVEERRRFFQLWTLKEAYIKARGMGMALPLQGFWFADPQANDGRLGFGAKSEIEASVQPWFFEIRDIGEEHQMALASRFVDGVAPSVRYREPQPGDFQHPVRS